MMWILPYILWGCVALFVWWLCGTIALVIETLGNELENKTHGFRVNDPLTPREKRRDIILGPVSMIILFFIFLVLLWQYVMRGKTEGFFVRPFAIVGSKVADWLVTTFITKSKSF